MFGKDWIYIIYLLIYHIISDVLSAKEKLLVRRLLRSNKPLPFWFHMEVCWASMSHGVMSPHLVSLRKNGKTSEGFHATGDLHMFRSKLNSCHVES